MATTGEPGLVLRQPRLPGVAVIGMEPALDAPSGWSGGQEELVALGHAKAASCACFCGIDERLVRRERTPEACSVSRASHYGETTGRAVRAPRHGRHRVGVVD